MCNLLNVIYGIVYNMCDLSINDILLSSHSKYLHIVWGKVADILALSSHSENSSMIDLTVYGLFSPTKTLHL